MKAWDWYRQTLGAALAGGALMLAAASAQAQECEADADCPDGFVCEGHAADDGCVEPAIACVGPDCPKQPACESNPYDYCVPQPCSSDSDCPESRVCYTRSYEACSSGGSEGCKPGEECAPPEPMEPECETFTESTCVPPHIPPCEADADCGPGFRCVEQISRGCSGGSGTGTGGSSGSGDFAPPPPPPECFEEATGIFACELIETPCATDDDCEAGLTCEANPNYPVCSSAGSPDGDPDAPADNGCANVVADMPTHVCLPPDYAGWGRDVGLDHDGEEGIPTSAQGSGKGGDANGSANPPPEAGDDEDEGPTVGHSKHGCSTAAGSGGDWLSVVGAMLLLGARRRRRE